MPYNVYLVDTINRIGSDERRNGVKAALQPYFDAIVKQAKVAGGAIVSFVAANPSQRITMVYFCSENWHVVSQLPGPSAINIERGGGLTVWHRLVTGSDVAADAKTEPRPSPTSRFTSSCTTSCIWGRRCARMADSQPRPSIPQCALRNATSKAKAGALMTRRPQWIAVKELADRATPITP